MAPKSVCGLDLPLDANYDYTSWRKQPEDQEIPDDMELQERNQFNHDAEMHNRASIRATRAYETDVLAGTVPPNTQDIGAKLRPYYKYRDDEMELMLDSEAYCAQVVAPLPPKLTTFLIVERLKRAKDAEKKKEEEKGEKEKVSSLAGSMVMKNAAPMDALTRASVSTPQFLLAAIKYRLHPSFFWFTDKRLRWATEHSAEVPMRKNTTVTDAPEKSLLDVAKTKISWGGDDSAEGHSLLDWVEASGNFLAALDILCAKPDISNPFSFHTELTKHFQFFRAMEDFQELYIVWYPIEKRLRNKILDSDVSFSTAYWTSEVGGPLNAHKSLQAAATGSLSAPSVKMADLGPSVGTSNSSFPHFPPPPRQPRREEDYRPARDPPTGPRFRDSWSGRDSFRDRAPEQRRSNSRERRPLHCLICAGSHAVKFHSREKPGITAFHDRTPFFSSYERGNLESVRISGKGERQSICIGFNCNISGRLCDPSSHPGERLHICSLCGGGHPALPGDARCARFRNGAFLP
ncbi:hypothetical protein B0H17DRAFT_1190678 [Mycena rosella]|uniref:Uncharacterized protein n=1 Tax=Mycena rosella TaxID=1033263 RepID=A0AAD7H0Y1_MYCRO|nr:hypothetical protein B0H17DRAFT_1190678 [Mycena rosella]